MAEKPKFYVYCFSDDEGAIYIGKGSGRRFNIQEKRFAGISGEILEWFKSEPAAYEAERRYIAERNPRLNMHPGGNGCRVRKARARRLFHWEKQIQRWGSRRYAACLLLAVERCKPGSVDASKLDNIRRAASGARS